jgi:hypothetical protein
MLGLALVASIVGVCWVAAEHECVQNIPQEIWFIPAALGGVLVGTLIPFSIYKREDPNSHEARLVPAPELILGIALLAFAAIAAGVVGATVDHLLALCVVGVVLGGMFFGLFIPAPGRRDP